MAFLVVVGAIALMAAIWFRTMRYRGLVPANRTTGALGIVGAVASFILAAGWLNDRGVSWESLLPVVTAIGLLAVSVPLVIRLRVR